MACGTPFEPKRANPHGYLATRLAVTPYFALRKMLPRRVWQPLVGQPARRIGTCARLGASYGLWYTLYTKITHPHGYLEARLAVTHYFALRKMLPGRDCQPLVGQPAKRIGT